MSSPAGFLQVILPTQNTKLQLSAAPGVAQRTQPCLILRKRVPPSRKYELTFLCGFVAARPAPARSDASESLQLENTKSNLSCGLQVASRASSPAWIISQASPSNQKNTQPNFPAVPGVSQRRTQPCSDSSQESPSRKNTNSNFPSVSGGVAPRAQPARSSQESPSISKNTKLQLPVVLVWSASSHLDYLQRVPSNCNTKLQSCCSRRQQAQSPLILRGRGPILKLNPSQVCGPHRASSPLLICRKRVPNL
jgi:hypothetical protein